MVNKSLIDIVRGHPKLSNSTLSKVTQSKSDTCFIFILKGEGLISILNNLISKSKGSEGKMVSEFLEAI
jgi:hypothetical protein